MKKFIYSICFLAISALAVTSPSMANHANAESSAISDNYIMISQGVLANGKVVREFDFSLNSPMLTRLGMSRVEIGKCKDALVENVNLFREEFVLSFTLIYKNAENKQPSFALGNDLVVTTTQYDSELDNVSFKIAYNTQEVWKFYSQSGSDENESEEKKDNTKIEFISTQTVSSKFPFAQEVSALNGKVTVAERYKNAYLSAFEKSSIFEKVKKDYNPDFVYNYASPYNKISSNADIKFVDSQNLYHHVWKADERQLIDKQINLTIKEANREWWYLTALVVTLVGTSIALAIAYLIKRKKLWQNIEK